MASICSLSASVRSFKSRRVSLSFCSVCTVSFKEEIVPSSLVYASWRAASCSFVSSSCVFWLARSFNWETSSSLPSRSCCCFSSSVPCAAASCCESSFSFLESVSLPLCACSFPLFTWSSPSCILSLELSSSFCASSNFPFSAACIFFVDRVYFFLGKHDVYLLVDKPAGVYACNALNPLKLWCDAVLYKA